MIAFIAPRERLGETRLRIVEQPELLVQPFTDFIVEGWRITQVIRDGAVIRYDITRGRICASPWSERRIAEWKRYRVLKDWWARLRGRRLEPTTTGRIVNCMVLIDDGKPETPIKIHFSPQHPSDYHDHDL